MVNITAAIGAFGFGYLQDAIGHVRALALTLVGWIVMVLIAGFTDDASCVLGGGEPRRPVHGFEPVGRPRDGRLARAGRRAEFFGLWGLAVKAASIFGPLTYGAVMIAPITTTASAFSLPACSSLLGLVLIASINIERGRQSPRRRPRPNGQAPSAAMPARAICASSVDFTPETPTAPTCWPSTMIGTPPSSIASSIGADRNAVRPWLIISS